MLRLVNPSMEYETLFREFALEIQQEGDGRDERVDYALKDFSGYVQERLDWSQGKSLPENLVPCNEYWLLDQGKIIVASSGLRHRLNENLRKIGGHIGYYVRPSQRQKGYGHAILKLTLEKAKELGLERVVVTCDEDNIASAKIIKKNGGVLEDTYQNDKMEVPKQRYWIDL
ncbi:MAG: GNAT family N-acetyltransferase [Planctomycetota bacterium]